MPQDLFSETIRNKGRTVKAGGNRSFLLNQPEYAWYIAHGYTDVFSVRFEHEQPRGSRNYFFSAGQGELLFGISSKDSGDERGLIAFPSPDAEIIIISMDQVKELWSRTEFIPVFTGMLELWVTHLSLAISKDINPRTDLLLEAPNTASVDAHLKIRSRKGIVWTEFFSGNALFLGMKEIMESGEHLKFPVSQDSWLQTMETSEIRSFRTADLYMQGELWNYLDNFYEVIFFCEFFITRLISVDDFNRLNEKAVYTSRLRSSALFNIASVINEKLRKSYIDTGHDALLTSCRIIADYSGITITTPKQPRSEEAPPLSLNDILRSSRFRARKVKLTGKWWEEDHGPLLAWTTDENLPVALIPKSPGKYEYISPGENIRQPLTSKTAMQLAPEAQQFYRPFPDQPIGGMHLIRFGLKNCFRDILLVILMGLAGGFLALLIPVLTGNIFDAVIPQSDYRQLYVFSMVIFFSIVAISLFQIVRSFAMIRIETKLDFSLQSALWDRLLNLPVSFFRRYQAGDLANKANGLMMLRKTLSDTVIYSMLGAVFMLFSFFLLFFYDVTLTLYIFLLLALSLLFIIYFGRQIQKHQQIITQLQGRIFGMLIQFLSSISKIKIAGAEVHAFSQWAMKVSVVKRQTYEVRKLFKMVTVFSTVLPLVITLFVMAVISWQPPDTLSTGQFMGFYTALTMTVVSFFQFGMAVISFFMAIPMLESIRPILEALPENIALKEDIRELSGEIEVANVSFRYQPDLPLVLHDVSLHIRPGEFVAIVGASGSGKSTLLRLLLGFESPEIGSIFYDRQDISAFDPASIRRQAGTVLQQSQLSVGTLLTNITGMGNATFEDAWEAARNVGLDEDIKQMPMGMHTMITGGLSTISGGQCQRIMIARAIVNKPRILFFDEATSALDNKTQNIVSKSLETLQATRVVIAHRLTTVQHADRIYLMEHGSIEEMGTYEDLLRKGGKFAELVKRQMLE
ncbi:MAG: NHLP bacteriocin export ABC transporter permease/ATPase subunit [Bacteroidales bacterium]